MSNESLPAKPELLDVLSEARSVGLEDEAYIMYVCHGPPRCTYVCKDDEEFVHCPWCYSFAPDDPRSTDELLRDMKRDHG